MLKRLYWIAAMVFIIVAIPVGCGCSTNDDSTYVETQESSQSSSLQKVNETDWFVFYCESSDTQASDDIQKTLEAKCPEICNTLGYQYKGKIKVEIYPEQKSYDASLIDKTVIGSPACSGSSTIKMVSPESPIKVKGIPYEERLMMAVHEYLHLMVDQINDDAPIWLDEGLASYIGSLDGYETICKVVFSKLPMIQFKRIEDSYHKTAGADAFSSSAVRYIIENYGQECFNQLLRTPEDFETILQTTKAEFDIRWNEYIREKYLT